MGGFLGLGGSSSKTDRGNVLAGQQGLWNVYGFGLPNAQKAEATGQANVSNIQSQVAGATANLNQADNYWSSLLRAGRTQTAANAAPAINAQLAQADTARRLEGATGAGRTGGTTAADREASTATQSGIDSTIANTLLAQRQQGATGLTQSAQARTGLAGAELGLTGAEFSNALGLGGLAGESASAITKSALDAQKQDFAQQQAEGQAIAQAISLAFL